MIRGKGWSQTIWYQIGTEGPNGGLVPGAPFCPGKSGFGWYPGLRRLDAGVPDLERSDVGGVEPAEPDPFQP